MAGRLNSECHNNRSFAASLATGQIAGGSCKVIQTFMSKDENEQREFLQNNQDIENLFRTLLGIVEKIYSDSDLTYWALCLLNGIIEDARTRIKNLDHIQKNGQNHKNCIEILLSFITTQQSSKDKMKERDLASHVLSMLIEHHGLKNANIA